MCVCVCVSVYICEFHCYFPGSMDSATVRVYDFLKLFSKSKDYKALKGACILFLSHLSLPRLFDCVQIFFIKFYFSSFSY